MPSHSVVTDFSNFSVEQLNLMLDQSDPASCLNAAQSWDSAGKLLHEQTHNLHQQLRSLDTGWSGSAATEYQQMMADLIDGMRKVADTAFQMRDLLYYSTDALNTAVANMPAPVDVPAVSPATVALATTPLSGSMDISPLMLATLRRQQAVAVETVQQYQQAIAAASTAQAKAVAVMQGLAGSYVTAMNAFPPTLGDAAQAVPAIPMPTGAANPSAAGAVPASQGILLSSQGTPQSGTTTLLGGSQLKPDPLFGNMFTLGLAAAAAAAVGGFGSLLPKVPGFAKRGKGKGSAGGATGGLGVGAATLGGAAGGAAATPTAGPGMGGADAGQLASLTDANAAAAAANGVAGADPMMPMMPMMPMGGMAGAGMGGAAGGSRRSPQWLVETQDVWGESFPAVPGLID